MTTSALPSAAPAVCDLCGLPLPSRPVESPAGRAYCCHGCAHVAAILEALGAETESGRRALETARAQGLLSSPQPPAPPAPEIPEIARDELRLRVQGLACPSCAWLVQTVLQRQPGVAAAHVDYLSDTARVAVDLTRTSFDALRSAVARAGYALAPLDVPDGGETPREWARLALAAAVAMNQMALAWVGYDTFFSGVADAWAHFVGWLQVALALPVVTWCALPLYRRAVAALRVGRVVMETLLSLGIVSASALSLALLLAGQAHVYLESATMLVALSLGGRALERHIKRRASSSLTEILQFAPTKARRADTGQFAPLGEFQVGDRAVVEPGETVPLDLRLETEVVVREGLLTGEPRPQLRRPGETILAGSVVESGTAIGRCERPAGQTVADGIRQRVEEALAQTEQGSRLADRLAQGFVPLVVLVALTALGGHLLSGAGLTQATLVAVAVLVVSCPCAFGVAASLALALAVLRLARQGTLVKEPAAIEAVRGADSVVFDKTGTLTRGDLTLADVSWTSTPDLALLRAVQRLEAHSRHPIGLALARLLPADGEESVLDVIEVPGVGVTGTWRGRRIAVGKRELFESSGPRLADAGPARTRVWFGWAGEVPAGHIDLADTVRHEAAEVVSALAARGLRSALLSGDAPAPTLAVAREVGIGEAHGGLLPEDKAAFVRAQRAEGRRVIFVGDGVNDAVALASADVGIALSSGADLALISAPVVLLRSDLGAVVELVDTARHAGRVLRSNFLWAFLYNTAFLPVAALGFLAPFHAALLMTLSSLSVALNSLRLRPPSVAARPSTLARGPL